MRRPQHARRLWAVYENGRPNRRLKKEIRDFESMLNDRFGIMYWRLRIDGDKTKLHVKVKVNHHANFGEFCVLANSFAERHGGVWEFEEVNN